MSTNCLAGLKDIFIEAEGAEFVYGRVGTFIGIYDCNCLQINGLSIDYDREADPIDDASGWSEPIRRTRPSTWSSSSRKRSARICRSRRLRSVTRRPDLRCKGLIQRVVRLHQPERHPVNHRSLTQCTQADPRRGGIRCGCRRNVHSQTPCL